MVPTPPLRLLDVHEERLVLGRLRIGIADVGSQVVHHALARAEHAGPAEVVRQAKRLEQAEATCRLLKEVLNDGAVKPLSEETRPPHY